MKRHILISAGVLLLCANGTLQKPGRAAPGSKKVLVYTIPPLYFHIDF